MKYRDFLALAKEGGIYRKTYAERVLEQLYRGYDEKNIVANGTDKMKKDLQDEIREKYYL